MERWDPTSAVVKSLVLYALAEAQAGHATRIRVSVDGTAFTVSDNGRGHAVEQTVDGVPYLELIYDQLAFPLGRSRGPAVQLQGIGISLINGMCSELTVTVRKQDASHQLSFRDGALVSSSRVDDGSQERGNALAGSIRPELQQVPVATTALERWLEDVMAATPGLIVEFNGRELR